MKDADETMASSEEKTVAEGRSRKVQLLGLSAVLLAEKDSISAAIGKLDEAIALEPGNPQLYKQRAFMHMSTENKEAAKKDLTIMVDIGQKSGDQNAAMEGQMLIQMLDQPLATASPSAEGTPGAPVPVATVTPGSATTVTLPQATPTAPATP